MILLNTAIELKTNYSITKVLTITAQLYYWFP